MKFNEIINEETSRDYIIRLTKDLKIERLGVGAYAQVFQHPVYANIAVKYVVDDPKYIAFAKVCLKSENRWLPNIVSIHQIKLHEEPTWRHVEYGDKQRLVPAYLIFFEKLSKAKDRDIKKAIATILKDIPDDVFWDEYHKDKKEILSFLDRRWAESLWGLVMEHSKDRDTKELAKLLIKIDARDIHGANVMIRADGQLVFTDPVAS